jgi:sugar phosphate isomerase/epimerase
MTIENRPTNASLSTMWALNNYPDLNDFFKLSACLGFQKIELNHQINSAMLAQVKLDHYQFSSIHEPCPADIPTKVLVERDWLISSPDEDSRKNGVESIKKSIVLAHELSAPVIVIHCGTVPIEMNYESKLRALFKTGKTESSEYMKIKTWMFESRKNLIKPRILAVKKSLHELLDFAELYHVKLGLENRYHYLDIPSIDEMEELLSLVDSNRLGFIYDVGHAQALDRLGFYSHEDWLKRFATRMIGTHLHDVIGLSDHLAPGLGEIDFYMIASYLPDESFRTLELLPSNSLTQVKDSLKLLVDTNCIKYL